MNEAIPPSNPGVGSNEVGPDVLTITGRCSTLEIGEQSFYRMSSATFCHQEMGRIVRPRG